MSSNEAGKGSRPRPIHAIKAYEKNMREIFGSTVRIPAGEEREEMILEIANKFIKHCQKTGLVVSMNVAILTIGFTLYQLEDQ